MLYRMLWVEMLERIRHLHSVGRDGRHVEDWWRRRWQLLETCPLTPFLGEVVVEVRKGKVRVSAPAPGAYPIRLRS